MTCSRCQSLMIPDVPLRYHAVHIDASDLEAGAAYRCVTCGEYVDAVILANRAHHAHQLVQEAEQIAGWHSFSLPRQEAA